MLVFVMPHQTQTQSSLPLHSSTEKHLLILLMQHWGGNGILDQSTLVTAAGLTLRNGGQGVAVAEATGGAPASGGQGSKTDISKTFTAGVGVANQVVDGAALLNNGTGGPASGPPTAVLAAQLFTQGSVTLNESDTLLITWTIELG